MLKLKNYTWAFLVATVIIVAVSTNVQCTGKAEPKTNAAIPETAAQQPAAGVITLTDADFEASIQKGVVLVDFWATWCRPCRIQGPIIEEVQAAMGGKVMVGKLDVDRNPKTSGIYGIMNIPTMLIFKDGKVVGKFMGVTEKDVIVKELQKFI